MNISAGRLAALVALAALLLAAIIPAAILLARGNGNAPIQIISSDTESDGKQPSGGGSAPSQILPAEEIRVYINGAVQEPGVYSVHQGDRLVDALAAAGGSTDGADLNSVNLALRVQDEGYYYIPREGESPPLAASPATAPEGSSSPDTFGNAQSDSSLVNLNTASEVELTSLPGIGEVRAKAILAYRKQSGPFKTVEEITNVTGIGSGTYNQIRGLVTVGAP